MRKNVASQVVCAQMNARADGSPLTTAVSVFYLIDGGSQTAGGGTLVHEGNGCWSYVPAQAETNGAHVAFTFVHASGVNQTVNLYPVAYDPGNATTLGLTNLDAAVSTRATPAQVATELGTYDAPTKAEMDAAFAALNDISVADILAGVIDGAWDLGDSIKEVLAYVSGDVAKAADAYTYKDRAGVGVFTNTVTLTARTRS